MDIVEEARSMLRRNEPDLPGLVQRDLALTLAQVIRNMDQRARAAQVMAESIGEVGTELLQMESQRWWYLMDGRTERWRDQQTLRARRASLETERIRLDVAFEQQARALEDRLSTLVARLRQLQP